MSPLGFALALVKATAELTRLFIGAPALPPSLDLDPAVVVERMAERFAPITFYFQNRKEEATFALLDRTGAVRTDTLSAFSRFVRCWRTEKVKPMHPRTVEVVAAMSRHFGGARVQVISGYRAKPYGARHSKHFLGRAMDVQVDGVPAKQVAEWVWKNFRGVGVGYYPRQSFVHIDTRPEDVRWIDHAKHGEGATARYFGRSPKDELPNNAPMLAYDRDQQLTALMQSQGPTANAVAHNHNH